MDYDLAQQMQLLAFGLLIGVSSLLAWLTGDVLARKVAMLQLLGWVGANLIVEAVGFNLAPIGTPLLDAAIAVVMGFIGYKNRSLLCFITVLLYLAQETVSLVSYATHNQGTIAYYMLQNSVFVLRMLALGGWAVGLLVADRLHRSDGGFPHRLAGG